MYRKETFFCSNFVELGFACFEALNFGRFNKYDDDIMIRPRPLSPPTSSSLLSPHSSSSSMWPASPTPSSSHSSRKRSHDGHFSSLSKRQRCCCTCVVAPTHPKYGDLSSIKVDETNFSPVPEGVMDIKKTGLLMKREWLILFLATNVQM